MDNMTIFSKSNTYSADYIRSSFLAKFPHLNLHYLDRYIKLIMNDWSGHLKYEKHHIFPKAKGHWPELCGDSLNLVLLPVRVHWLSHYLLYKMLKSKEMIYAFNMMRRVCKTSRLYMKHRLDLSITISRNNTGKLLTNENKVKISERMQGTVVVKDSVGTIQRVSVDDPRYLSGELVFYRVGYKHKEETQQKIKENGLKGRKAYTDGDVVIFLRPEDDIPVGFNIGHRESQSQRMRDVNTGSLFYYDPLTGKEFRFKSPDDVPEGLIRGRNPELANGWKHINDKIHVFCLKSNKILLVDEVKEYHIGVGSNSPQLMIVSGIGYNVKSTFCQILFDMFGTYPTSNVNELRYIIEQGAIIDYSTIKHRKATKFRNLPEEVRTDLITKYQGKEFREYVTFVDPMIEKSPDSIITKFFLDRNP